MVQYVSLHHPDDGDPDDTVAMNDGTLSVKVTITDGDGDPASEPSIFPASSSSRMMVRPLPARRCPLQSMKMAWRPATPMRGGLAKPWARGPAIASGGAGALNGLVNFGADGPDFAAFSLAVQSSPVNSGSGFQGRRCLHRFRRDDASWLCQPWRKFRLSGRYRPGSLYPDGRLERLLYVHAQGPDRSSFAERSNGDNTENLLASAIDLSKYIVATDGDGDRVKLGAGAFAVQIRDDIPTTASNTLVTVDEDDLAAGNHDTTSPGDDATSVSPVTGTLQFSVGADEPATVGFASLQRHRGSSIPAVIPSLPADSALSYVWDSVDQHALRHAGRHAPRTRRSRSRSQSVDRRLQLLAARAGRSSRPRRRRIEQRSRHRLRRQHQYQPDLHGHRSRRRLGDGHADGLDRRRHADPGSGAEQPDHQRRLQPGHFSPAGFGGIARPGSVTGWTFSGSTVEPPATAAGRARQSTAISAFIRRRMAA